MVDMRNNIRDALENSRIHRFLISGYNRLDLSTFVSSLHIAVNCGHPGKPRHGNITESGFTYQKVVSFSCNKYFELQGDRTRQCQADGKWSGEQPKCVASKLLEWVGNLDLKKYTFSVLKIGVVTRC